MRQAMERDEQAIAAWKAETWPGLKAPRATWVPSSASRTRRARAEAAKGAHLGPSNFAAADLDGLVRIVKRKLKEIQYRPHLIDGCWPGPA